MSLSSQEMTLVAVGENSQYLIQLLCCLRDKCSLLSTVDHTLTSLSSPQEARRSPSHEKPTLRIRALWALMRVTSLLLVSKSTSQNLRDSSLLAETSRDPLGLNFKSWIWFWINRGLLYGQVASLAVFDGWDPRARWHYPYLPRRHTCWWDAGLGTWWILCVLWGIWWDRGPIRYTWIDI